MTPEEKAKELVKKFYEAASQMNFNENRGWFIDEEQSKINAKQCAAICVQSQIDVVLSIIGYEKHWWTEHERDIHNELQSVLLSIQKQ